MNTNDLSHLRELGLATVYEASGREGLVDAPLMQVIAHSRLQVRRD